MEQAAERSYISPRNVRAVRLSQEDVAAYRDLKRIGISFDELEKGNALSVAMDAIQSTITTGSMATPLQFLQTFLPGFVSVITAARKIDELVGISTIGNWIDEEVVQGVLENTGKPTVYGDYSPVPLASWNMNFERRTVVRFEQGMRVAVLEEGRAAAIRVNSAETKRNSVSIALDIQRNAVGFFGYNSGNNRTYGFLNDPNLPAYVTVATGVGGVTWALKTFLEIAADIRGAVAALRSASQDTLDPETTDMTLAVATAAVDRLSVTSDFGISVRDWISKTYPRMRIVSAPQLTAANGGANVFYLYAESVQDGGSDDGRVWTQPVPARFNLLGVAKGAKGYEEDYSNATAGVFLKRPFAVVRRSGI